MKKINTLILLMGLMGTAFAQTYYSENFNTGSIPAGYVLWVKDGATTNATLTAAQYGWTSAAWMIRPITTTTDYWVASPSWFTTNVNADRWLCTPQFTVPAGSPNVLLKWDAEGYYGAPGTYEVRASTTDSNTTSFTTVLTTITDQPAWTTHAIALPSNLIGVPIRLAFRNTSQSQTGYAVAIDNINVQTAPSYDMSVLNVEMYEHTWTGTSGGAAVQGYLTSFGYTPVTSYRLNYSLNGGPTVSTNVTGVNITASSIVPYSHPTMANPTTDGTYKVKVWCDMINGSHADSINNNDTATTGNLYFYTKPTGVAKKVMIEEMTGAGCPWCPGGALTLREVLQSQPDVVGVAIHSASINDLGVTPADAMAITVGESVVSAIGSGLPSAMIDRTYWFDQGALGVGAPAYVVDSGTTGPWAQLCTIRNGMATPVNVSLDSVRYDSTTRVVSAIVRANFLNTLSTGDFRTNMYVVEDSVIITGNGYDQDNSNYSNQGSGAQLPGAGVLNTMPTVVTNDGLPGDWAHNHVLRSMAGGSWGTAASIPASPQAGTTYSKKYTYTVPANQRPHFMTVVGMVQEFNSTGTNYNLRQVLNVAEARVPYNPTAQPRGIENVAGLNTMSVYPNPASTMVKVQMDLKENAMVAVSVVNSLGQTVSTGNEANLNAGIHTVNVPVNGLATGLYFVKVTVNGQSTSQPLSIESK
jgi:hypothetical protein